MSKRSWIKQLSQTLPSPSKTPDAIRLAIVGIGNALSGDDAAGGLVIERLSAKLNSTKNILLVDGGLAPENFTGVIRQFKPDALLFIDTALMGQEPGAVGLYSMDQLAGLTFSTHTLPPAMIAEYLADACSCQVYLIGMQPLKTGFEEALSPEMQKAINEVTEGIVELVA